MKSIFQTIAITLLMVTVPFLVNAQPKNVAESDSADAENEYDPLLESYEQGNLHQLGLSIGYSFDSFTMWGKTPDATLSMTSMRYSRKLINPLKEYTIRYTLDMNMSATYTYPSEGLLTNNPRRSSTGGFGFAPLGFQIDLEENKTVSPFIQSAAGFILLKEPFPDERGTRFNFTLEFGAGLNISLSDHLALFAGYKYHHMSNGERGIVNPGVDSNFLFGGLLIR